MHAHAFMMCVHAHKSVLSLTYRHVHAHEHTEFSFWRGFCLLVCTFETESHPAQADLQLTMHPRLDPELLILLPPSSQCYKLSYLPRVFIFRHKSDHPYLFIENPQNIGTA